LFFSTSVLSDDHLSLEGLAIIGVSKKRKHSDTENYTFIDKENIQLPINNSWSVINGSLLFINFIYII
jgi:hypothetical protein